MADFKVGDTAKVVRRAKILAFSEGLREAFVEFESAEREYVPLRCLEHVSPASPPSPDPRDAEIERLRSRVVELESQVTSEDRAYYRQLVAAALGGLSENADVTHWRPNQLSELSIEAASYTLAAVKRREGGDDSASERPLQENCKKNFLVRGKNLLGG
jgi:hypothetical protein